MWTYRIVQTSYEDEIMMGICEVYYDDEKRPAMYCSAEINGEDLEEVKTVYAMIADAFKAPVLRYPEDFSGSIDRG